MTSSTSYCWQALHCKTTWRSSFISSTSSTRRASSENAHYIIITSLHYWTIYCRIVSVSKLTFVLVNSCVSVVITGWFCLSQLTGTVSGGIWRYLKRRPGMPHITSTCTDYVHPNTSPTHTHNTQHTHTTHTYTHTHTHTHTHHPSPGIQATWATCSSPTQTTKDWRPQGTMFHTEDGMPWNFPLHDQVSTFKL